ncbi:hypothetical protein NDU88_003454 [Pleurodeles waltl]|uniref:Uncharacterized protein n=1 Tax=Pleurodeles waltl TaxID=8319 RepID=A0AAV7SFC7_PLEWA|nr:hypothetical protein NDU88_003454 [Pleurodeles waltl]
MHKGVHAYCSTGLRAGFHPLWQFHQAPHQLYVRVSCLPLAPHNRAIHLIMRCLKPRIAHVLPRDVLSPSADSPLSYLCTDSSRSFDDVFIIRCLVN